MIMRFFNFIFSLLIIILTFPIWIIVAILIKLESKGTILFTQTRVGFKGNSFKIIKFRGMYSDAKIRFPEYYKRENNISLGEKFHVKNDRRVTKIGKFIRKTSIDELPNFLNVIKGEMTIIGPRPEIPEVFESYGEYKEKYISYMPGVTSYSKVYGRDNLNKNETLKLDFEYLSKRTFKSDLNIILRTACLVLFTNNVF